MNQTQKMVKNLVPDSILAHFGPNLVPPPQKKIVLWVLSLLDVMNCCKI